MARPAARFAGVHLVVAATTLGAAGLLLSTLRFAGLAGTGWYGDALLFALLFVVAELHPIRLMGRSDVGEYTASATFGFALLLTSPLPVALTLVALGTLLAERRPSRPKPWIRTSFNVSQVVVAFGVGGWVIETLGGRFTASGGVPTSAVLILLLAGLAMYLCNMGLTSAVIAVDQHVPIGVVLRRELAPFDVMTHLLLLGLAPVFVLVWSYSRVLAPLLLLTIVATYHSTKVAVAGQHDSRHDPLTGLGNRRLFDERLSDLTSAQKRAPFATMLMDLDRFKAVNDALGHDVGDHLLKLVAKQLDGAPDVDTIARVGGDEFAFLVRGAHSDVELLAVAQRLVDVVSAPYQVQGVPLQVGASVGIARFPDHGDDAPTLMRNADSAMYAAKRADASVRIATTPDGDRRVGPGRNSLLGDVETALAEGQFRLHYQPQIELHTGRIAGLEALLRWQHPLHGPISPATFIPAVEHTDLRGELTRYVIDQALRVRGGAVAAAHQLPVSVNISARDLLDLRLPRDVAALLTRHGTDPQQVTLEVTENALLPDIDRARSVIEELLELGVGLSVDDFGTGYATLTTLRDLPFTEIKIERSFVAAMGSNRPGSRIVHAILGLARELDLRVVAEGIERPSELEELSELGCSIGQGYLLCHPLPPEELDSWMRTHQPVVPHPRGRLAVAAAAHNVFPLERGAS